MPIPLPNLDDRTYAELTAEARALIPTLHPDWTDHNPSDPGIVLVELLAWLTEMLLFQVNEIPDASTETFLRLLHGRTWSRPPEATLDDAIRDTIGFLRERYRAVTVADYEHLIRHDWPGSPEATALGPIAPLARIRAVARRNLAALDPAVRAEPAPAHISVVVVPEATTPHPQPSPDVVTALAAFLAPRRMLTTRLHVMGPSYADIAVVAKLALQRDAPAATALDDVSRALAAFLDPLTGGPDRTGWPFGRDVHASEIYATLEQVPVVDFVDEVRLGGDDARPVTAADGSIVAIALDAHELPRLSAVDLTTYDDRGRPAATRKGAP